MGPEEVNGYLLFLVPDQQPTVIDPECGLLSGREARDALGTRFQQPLTLQSPYVYGLNVDRDPHCSPYVSEINSHFASGIDPARHFAAAAGGVARLLP